VARPRVLPLRPNAECRKVHLQNRTRIAHISIQNRASPARPRPRAHHLAPHRIAQRRSRVDINLVGPQVVSASNIRPKSFALSALFVPSTLSSNTPPESIGIARPIRIRLHHASWRTGSTSDSNMLRVSWRLSPWGLPSMVVEHGMASRWHNSARHPFQTALQPVRLSTDDNRPLHSLSSA
jgi:hypothetical protein